LNELEEIGHRAAIPTIRQAFWNDASKEVRYEAAHTLAMLGDTEMVEVFVRMLASRGEDEQQAKVAVQALGRLGDVRGLNELLSAYADGHKPGLVAHAIRAFGPVALEPLIDLIEARPEVVKRQAALETLRALDDKELSDCLVKRIAARQGAADLPEKAHLYLKVAEVHTYTKRQVAQAIVDALGKEQTPGALSAVRAARKAVGM
jgi:HEAT repeat protein